MTGKSSRWTTAAITEFLRLCRLQMPRDGIAQRLGWSVSSVANLDAHLRRYGRQPYKLRPASGKYEAAPKPKPKPAPIPKPVKAPEPVKASEPDRPVASYSTSVMLSSGGCPRPNIITLRRASIQNRDGFSEAEIRLGRAMAAAMGGEG